MANFDKRECRECIGNTICADETLFQGGACKKFAFKVEALKSSHNNASLQCLCVSCSRLLSNGGTCQLNTNSFVNVCGGYAKAQQAIA
jgi:hypothetical protein